MRTLGTPAGARSPRAWMPGAAGALWMTRVEHPMFRLDLFRIRAFTAGNLASLLVDRDLLLADDRRLSSGLSAALHDGLIRNGVPAAAAEQVSHLPPVASQFAAFLGYNPMQTLLAPDVLHDLSAAHQATLTGRSFFPMGVEPVAPE